MWLSHDGGGRGYCVVITGRGGGLLCGDHVTGGGLLCGDHVTGGGGGIVW